MLYASDPGRAPVYLGVQLGSDERIRMLVYPFGSPTTRSRAAPTMRSRGQLRYGSEGSWKRRHPVGRDITGVDVTMILGIDPARRRLPIGLDANLWDPLPMGISFYAKAAEIERAQETGWHVWEKENRGGNKHTEARSPTDLRDRSRVHT